MELSEKARQLRNENARIWRKNNPDKVREYNSIYWERKAAAYTDSQRAKDLKAKGLKQREIACIMNISLGTVNGYLNKG